jgi:hypothetical protein
MIIAAWIKTPPSLAAPHRRDAFLSRAAAASGRLVATERDHLRLYFHDFARALHFVHTEMLPRNDGSESLNSVALTQAVISRTETGEHLSTRCMQTLDDLAEYALPTMIVMDMHMHSLLALASPIHARLYRRIDNIGQNTPQGARPLFVWAASATATLPPICT